MQYLSFTIDWLYSTTSLIILGTLVITLLSADRLTTPTNQQLLKTTFLMTIVMLVSGFFLPSIQAISLTGNTNAALDIQSIKLVLFSTRFGSVWMTQQGLALLLLLSQLSTTWWMKNDRGSFFIYFIISLISIQIFVGAFKGHAAGLEPAWPGLIGHGLHMLAAGSWLGALPALIFLLRVSNKPQANSFTTIEATQLLTRFSTLATTMVGIILLSGIFIGYLQIDRWGELFATQYGQYLLIKVFLFITMLLIAGVIRQHLTCLLNANELSPNTHKTITKWILLESSVGLILLGVANAIKNTTPSSHEDIISWPFSFRLSLDATWGVSPSVQTQVYLGLIFIALAIGLSIYFFRLNNNKNIAFLTGIFLLISGCITALQPLSIPANPYTYRNSTVPYNAISIRNGSDIFSSRCADCHGIEGRGDGILSNTLDVMLMDLNHTHSAAETAGDQYWALTQEQFKTTAHSSIDPLDEDETWELINYLGAQANSYSGLSLYTYIDPLNPFLGAPDFYYATPKTSGNLKNFREDKTVLLVLYSWPDDKNRLDELKKNHNNITATNTEVIAVEITNSNKKEPKPDYPFILVTEQTQSIVSTYSLFRRSKMGNRDFSLSRPLKHIEFIIDRFGYLRARWIPEANTRHWTDFSILIKELKKLKEEPKILPPPDEHVH